jgi:hypothetical protein
MVIVGVVGAFFVTNRQKTSVMRRQEEISRAYAIENAKIEDLKKLEAQKKEMIEKAEITTALIEKAPRSILLAEIINRMPRELTLTELNLRSKRLDAKPSKIDKNAISKAAAPKPRTLAGAAKDQKTVAKAEPPAPAKPMPPRYDFRVEMLGLAATDQEIADYHTALRQCPLLENVELLFSGDVKIDDFQMRKFRIEANIRNSVDARNIEPLQVPRLPPRPGLASLNGAGHEGADPNDFDSNNLDPTIPVSPVFTNADREKKE